MIVQKHDNIVQVRMVFGGDDVDKRGSLSMIFSNGVLYNGKASFVSRALLMAEL